MCGWKRAGNNCYYTTFLKEKPNLFGSKEKKRVFVFVFDNYNQCWGKSLLKKSKALQYYVAQLIVMKNNALVQYFWVTLCQLQQE